MDRRGFLGRAAALLAVAAVAKPQEALAEASAPAPALSGGPRGFRTIAACDACGVQENVTVFPVDLGPDTGTTFSSEGGWGPRSASPRIVEARVCDGCHGGGFAAHYDAREGLLFFVRDDPREKVVDRDLVVHRLVALLGGRRLSGAFMTRQGDEGERERIFQREKELQAIARAFNGREPVEMATYGGARGGGKTELWRRVQEQTIREEAEAIRLRMEGFL